MSKQSRTPEGYIADNELIRELAKVRKAVSYGIANRTKTWNPHISFQASHITGRQHLKSMASAPSQPTID